MVKKKEKEEICCEMNVDDDMERIIKGEKGGKVDLVSPRARKKQTLFLQCGIKKDCIGRSNICLEVVGKSDG